MENKEYKPGRVWTIEMWQEDKQICPSCKKQMGEHNQDELDVCWENVGKLQADDFKNWAKERGHDVK